MSYILEEKLREAACLGDIDATQVLLSQNIDVNSKNKINGWTALHWACKRGHNEIVRLLLHHGADPDVTNIKGERPANLCSHSNVSTILGEPEPQQASHYTEEISTKFTPNYIKNAPINGQVELGPTYAFQRSTFPATTQPADSLTKFLVLKVKIASSHDPDFIEIELPVQQLSYASLLTTCCKELGIDELQVERIRKLPDTRLRNDSDVRRLVDFQALEVVLKDPNSIKAPSNVYQSISTCKNQTVLY